MNLVTQSNIVVIRLQEKTSFISFNKSAKNERQVSSEHDEEWNMYRVGMQLIQHQTQVWAT